MLLPLIAVHPTPFVAAPPGGALGGRRLMLHASLYFLRLSLLSVAA